MFQVSIYFHKQKIENLRKTKPEKIRASIEKISKSIGEKELFISTYKLEPELFIQQKIKSKIDNLEYTRRVIQKNQNLISGAIGENLVVKEIKKLSDDFILINDFNLNFSPPVYNKKNNDRIYSIQIDHLLVSTKGIFILETKNWSKKSIDSIDLRSPVEQIKRANFGFYVHLSRRIRLNDHHWGEQRIPIRNLIVMINHKPKIEFKYVSVKLLKELNNYLNYFDPVLNKNQVNKIVEFLN